MSFLNAKPSCENESSASPEPVPAVEAAPSVSRCVPETSGET